MRYIIDHENNIELIISNNSTKSYSMHNHISVNTVGLIIDGTIKMKIGNDTRLYHANDTFCVPAFVPHDLMAIEPYSLLVLCYKSDEIVYSTSKEMWKLCEKLLECSEQKITIDEMSEISSVSKYQMIRNFKKEIGLTPHHFMLQNRIRTAQHLLQQNESMTKVAYDTGFCDQSHFIKQFEKIVGMSPSKYNSSVHNQKITSKNIITEENAKKWLVQCGHKFCKNV